MKRFKTIFLIVIIFMVLGNVVYALHMTKMHGNFQTTIAKPQMRTINLKLPLKQPRFHWTFKSKQDFLSGKLVLRIKRGDEITEIDIFKDGKMSKNWKALTIPTPKAGEIYFGFESLRKYATEPNDILEIELHAVKDLDGIGAHQTGVLPKGIYKAKGTYSGLVDKYIVSEGYKEIPKETLNKLIKMYEFKAFLQNWEQQWDLNITGEDGWLPPEKRKSNGSPNVNIEPKIINDIQLDPSVEVIVEETKKDLTTSKQLGNGALVYQIRSVDGQHSNARTEFHWKGRGRGGYKPGRVTKGDIKVIFERDGRPAELRVIHPDYHEFNRPITFKNGVVIVWDDIVLERVSPNNSCMVKGRVLLEDSVNPVDINVSADRTLKTTTNNDGEFILSNLRSGEIRITASKQGYSGLYATVSVKKGETATCEMNGYRIRKAKVRWAFQPDGSKNFTKDSMTTGTAILQDNVLDRVSFGEGFKQVGRHSDFLIYQKDDTLLIRNFDVRRNGPAFIEIDSSFDELTEIPEFERHGRAMNLKQGKVYVFRTYDGKNYAKMEVLEIID